MRALVAGLTTCVLVAACGTETGIIVAVEDSDNLTADVHELEVVVGVLEPNDPSMLFIKDREPNQIADVSGRELTHANPYTLLLHDGRRHDEPSTIVVAVIGRDEQGSPVAFGTFQSPQRFVSGKVLRKFVVLEDAEECDQFAMTASGCVLPDQDQLPFAFDIAALGDETCSDATICVRECLAGEEFTTICHDGLPKGDPRRNEGICREGVRVCIDGAETECLGDISPTVEVCNNLDDDCDGKTDESGPVRSCGVGACRVEVTGCGTDCAPGDPPVDPNDNGDICDGVDQDCDGAIDEDCLDCIRLAHPSIGGNDGVVNPELDAVASFAEAFSRATAAGKNMICVASTADCGEPPAAFLGGFDVPDGMNVVGGFAYDSENTTMVLCQDLNASSKSLVVVSPDTPITFSGGNIDSASLSRFQIRPSEPIAGHRGIVVDGAQGVVLGQLDVFGDSGANDTGDDSTGVEISAGSDVEIVRSRISAGSAGASAVGVESSNSAVRLYENCSMRTNGRCLASCSTQGAALGIYGHIATSNQPQSVSSTAVELDNSPGSVIDDNLLCGLAGDSSARGLIMRGQQDETVVSHNAVFADGERDAIGVFSDNCGDSSAWLLENDRIASLTATDGSFASGVAADTSCPLTIQATGEISAETQDVGGNAIGIGCRSGSACAIVDNHRVLSTVQPNPAVQSESIGVLCEEGSCNHIIGNVIAPVPRGDTTGIELLKSAPLVAQNEIRGGCAGGTTGTGVHAIDSSARIENNIIIGAGRCNGDAGTVTGFALSTLTTQQVTMLDVHSNFLDAGGSDQLICNLSAAVLHDSTGSTTRSGIYRNNIMRAGPCGTGSVVFREADDSADPYRFENNCFDAEDPTAVLYVDEAGAQDEQLLLTDSDVNDLPGARENVREDPDYMSYPDMLRPNPGSQIEHRGTRVGMPGFDFDGIPRSPNGEPPDIGPFQHDDS